MASRYQELEHGPAQPCEVNGYNELRIPNPYLDNRYVNRAMTQQRTISIKQEGIFVFDLTLAVAFYDHFTDD